MPVPAPRDTGATRDILTGWLGDPARLPGARITDLRTPEFTGFSSEILMADVEHGGGAEALAVRVAPSHYQVFPETRFAEQYRLMLLRGHRHPRCPRCSARLLRALLGILHAVKAGIPATTCDRAVGSRFDGPASRKPPRAATACPAAGWSYVSAWLSRTT
jgi:hypothetical protein